jgi:acyl-CoA reductase-like NAD-dependent aldehyde dehydrogenase
MIAGNVIVRLKKARAYLDDALRAIDSAEEEALATPKWRHRTRLEITDVLAQTQELLREAREVLDPGNRNDPGGAEK